MKHFVEFAVDFAIISFGYSLYHVYRHGYQPPHRPTVTEEEATQAQESARQKIIATYEKDRIQEK